MPLQNRVTPLGELIADPARGLVYGNRGCLHDKAGNVRRQANGRRWIACRLEFQGWQRGRMLQPGRFTELFFLDEATALAAGHRPCALCRRADYSELVALWRDLHPGHSGAAAIDAQRHQERLAPRPPRRRLHEAHLAELPAGACGLRDGVPHLVLGPRLLAWSPAGYRAPIRRPEGASATLITPPSLVALLRTGRRPLVPLLHPTATSTLERSVSR
ncbi:MAG: hypothetical protein ACXWZB_09150 [Gaiellaceae bacterium]